MPQPSKKPAPISRADQQKAERLANGSLLKGVKARQAPAAGEEAAKPAPLGSIGAVKAKLGRILDDQK